MKFQDILSSAAILLALTCASTAADFQVELVKPAQDAVVTLTPKAQLEYKTPAERGFNTPYQPDVVKHGESECSHPEPVQFEWSYQGEPQSDVVLQISKEADFSQTLDVKVEQGTKTEVTNLQIGTTYYWRVKVEASSKSEGASADATYYSPTQKFSTAFVLPQWYNVGGISNVRDAGGWNASDGKRFKMGLVFRGTEFDQHHALTEDGKQFLLNTLGIKTDFDLRGSKEWKDVPDYWSPLGREVNWINFPLSSYAGIFTDSQKELYRGVFKELAKPENYPMYIHCWGGADRCGTLNMAIKSVLGCSDNDIFMDYEMTTLSTHGNRGIQQGHFQEMLKKFEEYGSKDDAFSVKFVNYLKSCGVTDEEMQQIRSILLEDAK